MATDARAAPKIWRGRFYEDFDVGDVYPSRLGRTVTETDNIWFTCLTLNTNQVHFNAVQSERGLHGRMLVNSTFEGDTLWAESEILEMRESASRPNVGIVSMRCRGINQRREVVIEFKRTFMVYKRDAPEVQNMFPGTDDQWTV